MDTTRFDQLKTRLGRRFTRREAFATGATALTGLALARAGQTSAAQDATPAASPDATAGDKTFLFVQLADQGSWTPKPDEPGVYLLTLIGTGEQTLFFSDRPDRIVGTVATDQFLDVLGFTPVNPPNAAIVVQTPEGTRDVLVVELFDPVYTRTFGDQGQEILTYDAKVLSAYQGNGLEEWVPQADDDQLPQEFTQVSLFIDDCPGAGGCYGRPYVDNQAVYVGPVPGGPISMCWDATQGYCLPCSGASLSSLSRTCNETYPRYCVGGCWAQ